MQNGQFSREGFVYQGIGSMGGGLPTQGSGLHPIFSMRAVKDEAASETEGRPVFRNEEVIEILIAGDAKSKVVRKVSEEDRYRFHEHYARFKAGANTHGAIGTPVEQWTLVDAAQAATLKALNIFTVEALAEVPDDLLANLGMGARGLRTKAQAWLEQAKDNAAATRFASQIEERDAQIELLKSQMQDLIQLVQEKDEAEAPKRGKRAVEAAD
jgi:hypothetical protein